MHNPVDGCLVRFRGAEVSVARMNRTAAGGSVATPSAAKHVRVSKSKSSFGRKSRAAAGVPHEAAATGKDLAQVAHRVELLRTLVAVGAKYRAGGLREDRVDSSRPVEKRREKC